MNASDTHSNDGMATRLEDLARLIARCEGLLRRLDANGSHPESAKRLHAQLQAARDELQGIGRRVSPEEEDHLFHELAHWRGNLAHEVEGAACPVKRPEEFPHRR